MASTSESNARTVTDLLHELAGESRTLVQQQIELMRAEMSEKADEAKIAAIETAGGAVLLFAGVLLLLLGTAFGLGELIPLWLATLIIGVIAGGGGALLVKAGLPDKKSLSSETAKSVRESAHSIREQLS